MDLAARIREWQRKSLGRLDAVLHTPGVFGRDPDAAPATKKSKHGKKDFRVVLALISSNQGQLRYHVRSASSSKAFGATPQTVPRLSQTRR